MLPRSSASVLSRRAQASASSPRSFVASASVLLRRAAVPRDSTEQASASSPRLHRLRLLPVDRFVPTSIPLATAAYFFLFKMERCLREKRKERLGRSKMEKSKEREVVVVREKGKWFCSVGFFYFFY
ncbi:unnamed protein product [Linum trigynum]|uniref:Uncharacterized protein n=1 Tax=Linum trigynum TaxID=586398 RepID=A0AAV2EGN5_9ROSI